METPTVYVSTSVADPSSTADDSSTARSTEPRRRTKGSSAEPVELSDDGGDGAIVGGISPHERLSGPSGADEVLGVGETRRGNPTPATQRWL